MMKRLQRVLMAMAVGGLLLAGAVLPQPVSATENGVIDVVSQNIRLLLISEDTGERIGGAQFTLAKKADGFYTNISGQTEMPIPENGIDLGELAVGEYRITETVAPEGYIFIDEPAEFQVTADGVTMLNDVENAYLTVDTDGTYLLVISNMAGFILRLPSTGSIGTLPYTVCGAVFAGIAVLCGGIRQYRKERNI